MKNRVIIYPYKMASGSASALQNALNPLLDRGARRVRPDGTYRPQDTDLIINWGNSSVPSTWGDENTAFLNHPSAVALAANKRTAFDTLTRNHITTPAYTASTNQALVWLSDGHTILERHTLTGHSGAGIRIVRPVENGQVTFEENNTLRGAPLYVQYKKKRSEYRVHVFNGTVLYVQEKRRERERERTADESLVRSHQNGWIFCRDNINLDIVQSDALQNLAIRAVDALGLTFGAVDIIYNQREDSYYVLEVNTAPGLEGQSVTDYTGAILDFVAGLNAVE